MASLPLTPDRELQGSTTLPWALLGGVRSPNVLLQQSGVLRGDLFWDVWESWQGLLWHDAFEAQRLG